MGLRDSMRNSAAEYLRPGETVQAVFGAQTASQLVAEVGGVFKLLGLNRYRIVVITPQRVLILDAGGDSMTTARGVVAELPRSTRRSSTSSRRPARSCGCAAASSRTSRPPTPNRPRPDHVDARSSTPATSAGHHNEPGRRNRPGS